MTLTGSRIALTGATGFLGRYIARALLERGAHVIGVVRNPGRVPELIRAGVEMREADLAQPDRLAAAFAGAHAVVSNAALFSVRQLATLSRKNWAEHQRINVLGTQHVFDAVAAAHIRRVVHISSVAVYARRRQPAINEDHAQLSERTRPNPVNAYALSKALSEQLAWRLAAERQLDLTTLRPCAIYGAHDPNFMPIFKALMRWPLSIGPVYLRVPFVYAGDVAAAVTAALERDVSIGRAYNVTGDDHTFWEFTQAWKSAGGRAPRVLVPVVIPVSQRFDHTRASRELGWHNRPFLDAFRETLALEAG